MKYSTAWTLLAGFGLLSAVMAMGDNSSEQYLRKTLRNDNHTAEVEVDHSKVTVRLNRDSEENPQSVLLTFYDKDNRPTTLELKALALPPPDEAGISTYTGTLLDGRIPGESAGSLSPSQQSFIGIELSIPFTKGSPEILRLKPME